MNSPNKNESGSDHGWVYYVIGATVLFLFGLPGVLVAIAICVIGLIIVYLLGGFSK